VWCNVPMRGWINGVGGCPNVSGICIGCTMPGFDKFMPFMDAPPGSLGVRDREFGLWLGHPVAAQYYAEKTDSEPKRRKERNELLTGYKPLVMPTPVAYFRRNSARVGTSP
jgi:hydrogenase small subunit